MQKRLSRITLDLPVELHRELKIQSVRLHKSMRALLIEALEKKLQSLDKAAKRLENTTF